MKNALELLVLGAGGMLGTALQRVAGHRGIPVQAHTEADLDITDRAALLEVTASFAARLSRVGGKGTVVNAAAYTDVEGAEDDVDRAHQINDVAAGWVAVVAREHGLDLVHVSTDFVFDGTKQGAYTETDEPHPLSVYGSSKLAGEKAVALNYPEALTVRTSWTYGPEGTNFPLKILQRARAAIDSTKHTAGAALLNATSEPPRMQVVVDEVGSPTYSVDLAGALLDLLVAGASGLYHLAGAGSCSRYELALETLRLAGIAVPRDIMVRPVASDVFPAKAMRPHNSVLDCTKAGSLGVRLPEWQSGLARFVAEL